MSEVPVDPFDPPLRVDLPSGRCADFTVEDLVSLQTRLRDLTKEAYDARLAVRSTSVDMACFGLRRADFIPGDCWTLPDAVGSLPFGVPMLRFNPAARPNAYAYGRQDHSQDDCWQLVLSSPNAIGHPIASARHDDTAGITDLVGLLHESDPEVLAVQLALLADVHAGPMGRGVGHAEVVALSQRLLDATADLDPVDPDTVFALRRAGMTVSEVRVVDPDLCRILTVPGMLGVSHRSYRVADIDRVLARHGLVGLANRGRSWDNTDRYAVLRGRGARIGSLPEASYSTFIVSDPDPGKVFAHRPNSWGIAHAEALTLETREPLLARTGAAAAA